MLTISRRGVAKETLQNLSIEYSAKQIVRDEHDTNLLNTMLHNNVYLYKTYLVQPKKEKLRATTSTRAPSHLAPPVISGPYNNFDG